MSTMTVRLKPDTTAVKIIGLVLLAAALAGCAGGRAFGRATSAARQGDWDTAVAQYQRAVQEDPDNPEYKIALQRAMLTASLLHLDQARLFEARGQLEDALREYRRASDFDPPNRQIAGKVIEIERRIRDQAEAAQPRSNIQQLREAARQAGPQPLFNFNTIVEPIRFNQASLRDILNSIGQATGINVTYDSAYTDRQYTVQLEGVTLQEALNQILTANQMFYKVVNQRTILVIPDTTQKRQQYEELVIRTFYLSNADSTDMVGILNAIVRVGGQQTPPGVVANKTSNTITVRATAPMMDIIERVIEANDKPRAEIVVDVQILEVSRTRTRQFGLDLGSYAVDAVFSPEVSPLGGGSADAPAAAGLASRPFNANTISRGISPSDFYLSVPAAAVRFLETDLETKVIAKPQLRGAEGQRMTFNLGEEIPVPSTTFTPIAQGGANFNPLTSFQYRPVGIILEITSRVTFENEIILELSVESSSLGQGIVIAGQGLPSFNSRKVQTRLRLREGESNLLAGLLRESDRRALRGLPAILRFPLIRQLFSANDNTIEQTDIVMLLTPRIVRTHELTAQDVGPIFIGTQNNLGLSGPPPLIAPVPGDVAPAEPIPPAAPGAVAVPPAGAGAVPPAAGIAVVPPGSNAVPGTTNVPAAPAGPGVGGAPVAGSPVAPVTPPVASGGQILVSPPSNDLRVGGGPYTVPISISGASQISNVTMTITYNPAALRVRTVQEGSFMRAGGVAAAFTQQVDATTGRIDIAIARTGDVTGVAGTGLLAALLFDAVAPGPANLTITGTATGPGGSSIPVQFTGAPNVAVR